MNIIPCYWPMVVAVPPFLFSLCSARKLLFMLQVCQCGCIGCNWKAWRKCFHFHKSPWIGLGYGISLAIWMDFGSCGLLQLRTEPENATKIEFITITVSWGLHREEIVRFFQKWHNTLSAFIRNCLKTLTRSLTFYLIYRFFLLKSKNKIVKTFLEMYFLHFPAHSFDHKNHKHLGKFVLAGLANCLDSLARISFCGPQRQHLIAAISAGSCRRM